MLEALFSTGSDLIVWLQSWGDWVFPFMKAITFLGSEDFYLLVMPILFWAVDTTLGIRVGVMLILTSSANTIFKWIFHLPRPFWTDPRVKGLVVESSFGAPSGHSQTPLSIFGLMAASAKKGWGWILALVIVFLIGVSRLFLGVHFYLDVLVGWFLGGLAIWLFIKTEDQVAAWFAQRSSGTKIGVVFLVSLGIILLGGLVMALVGDHQIPPEWSQNALTVVPAEEFNPFDFNSIITAPATLFGLLVGIFWLQTRGGFDPRGLYWKRAIRILIGALGVIVLWQGLGTVFPRTLDLIGYSLRYLRYALVGFWIAGLAPWLFVRLNLATQGES
jgi:membrane-associated phospholipid phosphatase